MTELTDEEHEALHVLAENEILDALDGAFGPDNYMCRGVVLLKLLHNEFMLMEKPEDVSDLSEGILGMVFKRASVDRILSNPMGNA